MKEVLGIKLFDTTEASGMLGLSVLTIKAMLRDGRLSGRKIGKAWAIPEDSIKAFVLQTEKEVSDPFAEVSGKATLPQTDNSRTVGEKTDD